MIEHQNKIQEITFPHFNIYCSPRVHMQKINNERTPVCKYKGKIIPNRMQTLYESAVPQKHYLQKIRPGDGLIFNLGDLQYFEQLGCIKILICVCMYNQSKNALNRTLNGIYDNIQNLKKEGISEGDLAVVLIQDGILKLVKDRISRTYEKGQNSLVEFYKKMDQIENREGCLLQERINIILDEIDNHNRKDYDSFMTKNGDFPLSIEKNIALMYQNLWYPKKTRFSDLQKDNQSPPHRLKILSCFKHLNGTKLSSHLWFFEGFCRYINPKFCVLLDIGTKPSPTGIVNLLRGFWIADNVGGVAGLINVDRKYDSEEDCDQKSSNCISETFFSVERAQQYEYIISHILDKNAQNALGFLHVLPGAWSAYRYEALIKSEKYEPNILEKTYFKMILNPTLEEKDCMEANMYLAQDRILSLGIFCQTKKDYTLKYIPDAVAETDPMNSHESLMLQRRRWINSSLCAFLYVWNNYAFHVRGSSHGFIQSQILLPFGMLLALVSFINTYLTPSIYFFILYTTILQINSSLIYVQIIAQIVSLTYVLIYLIAVVGSLRGRQWCKIAHWISVILSVYTYGLMGLVIYNVLFIYLRINQGQLNVEDFLYTSVLIILLVSVACFFLLILMHIPTHFYLVCRLFLDQISYICFQGAYSQTMIAHAFCNMDDVSWGTKGRKSSQQNKFMSDKVFFVSSWLFYNFLLGYIFIYVDIVINTRSNSSSTAGFVLIFIAIYGTFILFIRTVLAFISQFRWYFCHVCCTKIEIPPDRAERVDKYWKNRFTFYKHSYF